MRKKELSVFIDESGDFGPFREHSPYYIVSMVFHEQSVDISENIQNFDRTLSYLGVDNHCIHTGPIIRQEENYCRMSIDSRRQILNKFLAFIRSIDIHFASVSIRKSKESNQVANSLALDRQLSAFLDAHLDYFSKFDIVKVYYDNGQVELSKLLSAAFSTLIPQVEFKKVSPNDYKLFQVADLICTFQLTALRLEETHLTESEIRFFHNGRDFRKNYLKPLLKKEITV